jgi:Flp pilus assembly protein TadB
MVDWAFAFFHLFLLIGVAVYALYSLFQGSTLRAAFIAAFLILYYFLVLHRAVKKEIERKRKEKEKP